MRNPRHVLNAVIVLALLSAGCNEKTPSRDHIPVLKEKVYTLQEAVKAQNRAAIDSILSPEILSIGQSSDSLLRFVYSPDDQFAFERFGDCEIVYTSDKARIDCFMMDSTAQTNRPIVFTFVYKHDLWLLKRFEPGEVSSDTDST